MKTAKARGQARHSAQYNAIRKEAETEWPTWKVAVYNASVAISAHAKKIKPVR